MFADKLAPESFWQAGNLMSSNGPLKPATLQGPFRVSDKVYLRCSVEQSASMPGTEDVKPNIQNKCVYTDIQQNDQLSFRTRSELN